MFLRIAIVLVLAAGAITYALEAPAPRPVQACSILGIGALDHFARYSDAVAIVQPVKVGGPENAAPSVTPRSGIFQGPNAIAPTIPPPGSTATPTPTATPVGAATATATAIGSPTPVFPPFVFDLTGYGARLRLVQVIGGALLPEFEVDANARADLEKRVREREANPGLISSCEIDRGMYRYATSGRYMVFLRQQPDRSWSTITRIPVSGDDALISHGTLNNDSAYIVLSSALRNRFFPDLPAISLSGHPVVDPSWGVPEIPPGQAWGLDTDRIPAANLAGAVRELRSGRSLTDPIVPPGQPTVTPGTDREPPVVIRPPDTGSAGLR